MSKHQRWLKATEYKKAIKALEASSRESQTIIDRHQAERKSFLAVHKAAQAAVDAERRRVLEGMPIVTLRSCRHRDAANVKGRLLAVLGTQVVIWIEGELRREVRFTRSTHQWWGERGTSYSGVTLDSHTLPVGAR